MTDVPDKTNTRWAVKALDSHATAKAPVAATGAELYSKVESWNNAEDTISDEVVSAAFSGDANVARAEATSAAIAPKLSTHRSMNSMLIKSQPKSQYDFGK